MSTECKFAHERRELEQIENETVAADKQFTREKVSSIVRNTERTLIKKLVNDVINEFNTFIHSPDSINKYVWEYKLSCHTAMTPLILHDLMLYFDDGMCTVTPTGDPYVISVRIIWY
jgi:hypothetical protein